MKLCCYKVTKRGVSHVLGKLPCEAPVRYTVGQREFCARHFTYFRSDQYGVLVKALKTLVTADNMKADDIYTAARRARALLQDLGEL